MHTHTLIPKYNFEKPIDLIVMFLDCGSKAENYNNFAFTRKNVQNQCRKNVGWEPTLEPNTNPLNEN